MAGITMQVAAKAASYNMVLQLIFRISTFAMNGVLLHYISREILGIVNVRLTLLYTTILFMSREAFRKACLSKKDNEDSSLYSNHEKRQKLVNLIWLTSAVGMFWGTVLSVCWIFVLQQPSSDLMWEYHFGTCMFALSSLLELFVEPLWIFGQLCSYVRTKVVIEGISLTFRCILTTTLIFINPKLGLISFSVAQVLSSCVYVALYYGYFITTIQSSYQKKKKDSSHASELPFSHWAELFPSRNSVSSFVDSDNVNLVISFFKQSVLKQILTEGERYVMTLFNVLSFGQQGVYDVINNLGSLAARFIFMPIEESYYIFFSQTMIRGKSAQEQTKEALTSAAEALMVVTKLVCLIAYTIVVFGYSYSFLLLHLYGGRILSEGEGPVLLQTYCLYVLCLAINGITECFMFALMSKAQVDRYNYKMLLFSCVFLLTSLGLTHVFGGVGFILANCFNMILRIGHSTFFIHQFFKDTDYRPLHSIVPAPAVMVSYLVAFACTALSEKLFCCNMGLLYQLLHVSIGGLCLLLVAVAVFFKESELVSFIINMVRGRKVKDN